MSKTIREKKLDTPAARARLKVAIKPYWRPIDIGLHLGYRRGLNGGQWVYRRYLGNETYETKKFAIADDHGTADGVHILDFFQAQRRAREISAAARVPGTTKGSLTVNMVLDAYFARLDQKGKSTADARGRADLHIRPAIGEILVDGLTHDGIAEWHSKLARKPKGGKIDPEAMRPRKVTANRLLVILRAALNSVFRDGKVASDTAWRTVQPFKNVDTSRLRYFNHDEIVRSTNAAQGAFRNLWKAGLYTGCRRGELTRWHVADYNPDSGTVFVGKSKSGKSRHVILTNEGQQFFSILCAGRPSDAVMLVRDDGQPWGRFDHALPTKKALAAANITGACFYTLRHTAASQMVMAGVPLNVVAQNLGHADTRMTERHYAHLSPSYVAETIRKFTPEYGLVEDSNLVPLRETRA